MQMVSKVLSVVPVLLRAYHAFHLPKVEPVGAQLIKLVKCEKNSSMQPIRSFWIGQRRRVFMQALCLMLIDFSKGWTNCPSHSQ